MEKIGKYTNLVEIGRGGMGVVYKGYDPYFKESVALKTMSSELSTDPKFREKFFEEGRSIRRLRHENIIQVFDLDEDGGRPYLTMELLEGSNLKERVYGRDRMALELKLLIMKEVCKGLAYAHEMGIIHRDIKPENIYITRSEHVKILDFGLARAAAAVTQGSRVIGTVHYMSPEHWQKKEDRRSDIFAAGAVFYEMLTLKRAFEGDNPVEVMRKVLEVDPEPIETINPMIPAQLSTIILKALSRNPDERYQKMEEFLKELEAFEKSLDEHKHTLQKQNVDAIEKLCRLIAANKDLLRTDELEGIKANWPFMVRGSEIIGADESKTIYRPRYGYFELIEDCEKARREYELLRVLVQKRREASPVLNEAVEFKNAGQFEAAQQTVERILQVDPGNTEALSLYTEISARIEELRLQAEKERQIVELFDRAVLLSQSDDDLQGCVGLLNEILSLKPGHETATALREEVQQKIKEQQELEEKRRRAQEALDTARQSLKAGDLKLARQGVEKALTECPDAAGVGELLDEIDRAEDELRLRKERESQIRKLLEEALALGERGEDEEALARVNELMAMKPAHQQALDLKKKLEKRSKLRKQTKDLFDRARLKYSSGDSRGSLKLLNEVLKLEPGLEAAILLREEVQQKLKEIDRRHQAEQALTAALRSLAEEDFERGRLQVQKARSIYPELPRIADVVSRIDRMAEEVAARREREEQVRRLLEEARSLLEKGEEVRALDRINELLRLERRHIAALRLKREIETRRQARERAEALFQKARAKLLSNDVSAGLRLLDEILKLHPGYLPAVTLREEALEKIKEQAEEENRRQAEEALSAAQKALKLGDFDRSREEAERARAFDPKWPPIFALLEEIDQAEEKQRAASERERRVNKLWEEAQSLKGAGEEEMALERIIDLLALEPTRIAALKLKNEIEAGLQNHARAEEFFQNARTAFSSGQLQESLKWLEKALELRTDHTAAVVLRDVVLNRIREETDIEVKRRQAEQALASARRALAAANFKQAREELDRAWKLCPELPDISPLMDSIERAEAEEKRKARQAEGEREKQLGLKMLQEKMFAESLTALQRAEQFLPADSTVGEAIAEVRAAIRAEELRVKIQAAILEARKLLNSEEFDAARKRLLQVKGGGFVGDLAAQVKNLLIRIDQAEEEKNKRDRIATLRAQSRQAFIQEDFGEASVRVEQWLLLEPQNAEAGELRGRIKEAQAKKERTAQLARQALFKIARRFGVGALTVALLVVIAIWIRGLLISADFNRKCEAHFSEGRYEAAQQTLDEWVSKYPENKQAQALQGKITKMQDSLKRFEAALTDLNYEQASSSLADMKNTNPLDRSLAKRRQRLEDVFSAPFQDDFLSGLDFWNHPKTWLVDSGKLMVRGPGLGMLRGKHYRDFEEYFTLSFANDKGAVWILRAKDKNNYYMFQLAGPKGTPANSFAGFKFVNGERKSILGPIPVGANLGVKDDQFNIIIKANGKTITHEIKIVSAPLEEPRSLGPVEDVTFLGGSIGFGTKDNEDFIVRSLKIIPNEKNR